ncbi:MAG TPA: hypothetical protein DCK98_14095 [Chloroflexi bacterium]|jgi:hypothetical protein|nr:hypothetical protein [Chloroflexota bacterium]HAL25301.1 hypothetical protein [Chloroflexota bacterium]
MRRLLVIACLLASACTTDLPAPSPSSSPQAQPIARVSLRSVGLENGLTVDVPVGWSLTGVGSVNRATERLLLAGNTDVVSLPTIPNNGDLDVGALPSGSVTVEVESFCSMFCAGPADETPLPLDWSAAVPFRGSQPPGRHELALSFRWFDRPLFLVARWVDDAPASDIAAIADIARSVRPDPKPPATGEFNGWAGLGPLESIPLGTVRLVPLPVGAIIRPAYRTWDNEPFFIVHEPTGVLAFSSKPLVDRRCVVAFDAPTDRFTCSVDGRTFAWTRRGSYLGPEPASDMRPMTVIVRDGSVWVAYSD